MKIFSSIIFFVSRYASIFTIAFLLAISIYILKTSKRLTEQPIASSKKIQFDYFLNDFLLVRVSPAGQITAAIHGEYASHSPIENKLYINRFIVNGIKNYTVFLASALMAELDDDGNETKLVGKAKADFQNLSHHGSINNKIESEYFQFSRYPNILLSNQPTALISRNQKISGLNFQYDFDRQVISFSGKVTATFSKEKSSNQ